MCNEEALFKDHTLKFVYVTRWRTKEPPLKLQYSKKTGYED
jgi:polycomb group RING finger protein 3